jgi:hypothetical protein
LLEYFNFLPAKPAVRKQTTHRVRMERFNLKKLNEVEGKEQYLVEISDRFTALENLDTELDFNRAWETIREDIKILYQTKRVKVIMN